MNIDNIMVLGLDISKERTGFSILQGRKVLWYNHFSCPKVFKKVRVKDEEFSHFLNYYYEKIKRVIQRCYVSGMDYVAIEDLNIRFAGSAKVLLQLQAAAKIGICSATEGKCLPIMIHNKTVKSALSIPNNNSPELKKIAKFNKVTPIKLKMVDAVNDKFNLSLSYGENDEADSIALSYTLLKKLERGDLAK